MFNDSGGVKGLTVCCFICFDMRKLDAVSVQLKEGTEPFLNQEQVLPFCLLDFWAWAFSDLLNNALRGIIAEYIVKQALGLKSTFRTEWDAYDLQTEKGLKIEVKSAAYLQSWKQTALSSISFGIAPTKGWNPKTNDSSTEKKRHADFYIFCLLHHQDKQTVNPLHLDQWTFYVLKTAVLNEHMLYQQRISLKALLKLQPMCCSYEELAGCLG